MLQRLLNSRNSLKKKLHSYEDRRRVLLSQLASSIGGAVSAERVYQGVKVIIRAADFDVKELMERVKFIFDGGKIKVASL
jgi:uncharacterized protein (DUF342 family)